MKWNSGVDSKTMTESRGVNKAPTISDLDAEMTNSAKVELVNTTLKNVSLRRNRSIGKTNAGHNRME